MRKTAFIVLTLIVLLAPIHTIAAKRTALIIGNSAYNTSPLTNPVNDARDMATTLKSLDFDVILKVDATKKHMVDSIRSFGKKLTASEIGLFYYAGHGMQINGTNYLIPVNNSIQEESEVEFEAIDAGRILAKMNAAGNPMNIVILDACRDNPFKRSFRTSAKGLAKMDAPPGTVIAYATSPGSAAADGSGRNGTYTAALLGNLKTPGIHIRDMFNLTGLAVMQTTDRKQVPWLSTTPFPDYYLAMGSQSPMGQVQVQEPVTKQPITIKSSKPKQLRTWADPTTGMEFVWIPKGCYQMGSNLGEAEEKPVHKVCVDGVWMGKYEVTIDQFRMFLKETRKTSGVNFSDSKCPIKLESHFSLKGNIFGQNAQQPMVAISWFAAKAFAGWLNQKGLGDFRLPTEAEWEYAARAGTRTIRFWGDDLEQACTYANVYDRMGKDKFEYDWEHFKCNDGYAGTAPVGSFKPNPFGLYDMLGNVWEWCEDELDKKAYEKHMINNPIMIRGSGDHVLRGGCLAAQPDYVRSAVRVSRRPEQSRFNVGFRLVRQP